MLTKFEIKESGEILYIDLSRIEAVRLLGLTPKKWWVSCTTGNNTVSYDLGNLVIAAMKSKGYIG